MLIENFYLDSRGNERSAGVMETTIEEIQSVAHIKKAAMWSDDELCIFLHVGGFLYCIGEKEELRNALNQIEGK